MDHLSDTLLNEYLDQTLEASTRRAMEGHLRSCPECQARFEEIQNIFTLLAELPDSHLQNDLRSKILTRLPQKQPRALNPFFAAQLGAALGTVIWLVSAASALIKIPTIRFSYPEFLFPNPAPLVLRLAFQFPLPSLLPNILKLRLSLPDPIFRIPPWSALDGRLSISHLGLLIAFTLFLGLVGNAYLLGRSSEVQN